MPSGHKAGSGMETLEWRDEADRQTRRRYKTLEATVGQRRLGKPAKREVEADDRGSGRANVPGGFFWGWWW